MPISVSCWLYNYFPILQNINVDIVISVLVAVITFDWAIINISDVGHFLAYCFDSATFLWLEVQKNQENNKCEGTADKSHIIGIGMM